MSSEPGGSFSVTVPAHGDERLLNATLSSLVTGDESPSEVLVVVDTDDPRTREVAERVAARHRELVEVVDEAALCDVMPGAGSYGDGHVRLRDEHLASRRAKESWLALRGAATSWWSTRASPAVALTAAAAGRLLVRVSHLTLVGLPALVAGAAVVAATLQASSLGYVPFVAVSFVLAAIAWKASVRTVHAWRAPRSLAQADGIGGGSAGLVLSDCSGPSRRARAGGDGVATRDGRRSPLRGDHRRRN